MIGLSKKNIISHFLLSVIVSFIDTYIYPGIAERFLSLSGPATVFVAALLLFTGGIVLQKLSDRLRSSSLSWPEVNILSIKRLAPIYVLLVMVYIPLLLSFKGLDKFSAWIVGCHGLGAIFLIFYLLVRNTDFPQVLTVNEKAIEVSLQVLIPLVVIEVLSTLYINMVSLTTMIGVVYMLSWALACGLAFGLGGGLVLGVPYYFYMKKIVK